MRTLDYRLLLMVSIVLYSSASSCKEQELSEIIGVELTVLEKLDSISGLENDENRQEATASFWTNMKNEKQIPYTKDSLAIFFYYGKAKNVSWNGDFNSWSQDKSFDNDGIKIKGTKLWYWSVVFPKDARLDYKITIDGNNWILDPENQHQQWSGFGPNSELRMPEYLAENALELNSDVERGRMESFKMFSEQLQYEVAYNVYVPAGYENLNNLPIIYVTDGHEYSDDKLGNMITVLDNLIGDDSIEPLIAVFIDPRDPNNLNLNRRQEQYTINTPYLDFIVNELGTKMDSKFKTDANPNRRAILGTSLGGINSSYFGSKANHFFINIAIQSPAYWYRANQIFDIVQQSSHSQTRVFLTAGTFNDGLENSLKMHDIYEQNDVTIEMMTVNEGHSWGAWSAQLDDILIYFYSTSK